MALLGIDVGTQGARVLACDPTGHVLATAEEPFPVTSYEQQPEDWWRATTRTLRQVVGKLNDTIAGVSVTSTSGTVCLVDESGGTLGPALMYNHPRSSAEAVEVSAAGRTLEEKLGYRFASSFALPKLLWLKRHQPERFQAARHLLSPTDFIIGRLTGEFGVSDFTNVLKTGYDLIEQRWPQFIERELGIPIQKLPSVVPPATQIGVVSARAGSETGLPKGVPVLAGMTDGCASQVATGAVALNQWNSTLGTTLVLKGVTRELIRDPAGRVYCHRHPDGHWLPGGASNTGGECIARRFDSAKLGALAAEASRLTPTDLLIYPLVKTGERFPFLHPKAEGFTLGKAASEAESYTAHLEGVGYIERLAYEVLKQLGAEPAEEVYAAGGGAKVDAWLQIRADILQKTLLVPANSGGAMGAAILAAGGTIHKGIVPAAQAMVRITKRVEPRSSTKAAYDDRYVRFLDALRQRGYLAA
jgi:xylulokinase